MSSFNIDGLPVIDADDSVVVEILPRDIAKADRKMPAHCVVSRAIKRQLHAKEVRVHLGRVYCRFNEGNWVRYRTPGDMRGEIIAFDRGGDFFKGKYTLGNIPPAERGAHKKAYDKTRAANAKANNGKRGRRRPPHVIKNVRTGPATRYTIVNPTRLT